MSKRDRPELSDIEITPEMIKAAERAFGDWYGSNYNILEDGGTGDIHSLLLALRAACWNCANSNSSASSAL